MADVFDFNRFKKHKDKESQFIRMISGSQDESIKESIRIFKMMVQTFPSEMDALYVDCIGESEAIFKDAQGVEIDYKKRFNSVIDEEEYALITGLFQLAPSKIIITNSSKLNEHLLNYITEIFQDKVVVKD